VALLLEMDHEGDKAHLADRGPRERVVGAARQVERAPVRPLEVLLELTEVIAIGGDGVVGRTFLFRQECEVSLDLSLHDVTSPTLTPRETFSARGTKRNMRIRKALARST